MTNKLPVVGKRYKRNLDDKRTYIVVRVVSGKDSRTGCETYDIRDENDLNYKAMFNDDFMFDEITFKYEFEELPEAKEEPKTCDHPEIFKGPYGCTYCIKEGQPRITLQTADNPELGYCSPTWSNVEPNILRYEQIDKAKKTLNEKYGIPQEPNLQEKEEEQSVKEALGELKKEFNKFDPDLRINCNDKFFDLIQKARILVNALEAVENTDVEQTLESLVQPEVGCGRCGKEAYDEWVKDYEYLDNFRKKEERVKPVSIWKGIKEPMRSCEPIFAIGEKYCYTEDFVNAFDQMQKDIQELKRK